MTRIFPLALVFLSACSNATSAHDYLESEGFTGVTLRSDGSGGYRFQAVRDRQACTGTVRVGVGHAHFWRCGPAPIECHPENPRSCVNAAVLLRQSDPAASEALLLEACVHGMTEACVGWDDGTEAEALRRQRAQRVACGRGVGLSCNILGVSVLDQGNRDEASRLYLHGCALGSGVACSNAADLRKLDGKPEEEALFRIRACSLGYTPSCREAS